MPFSKYMKNEEFYNSILFGRGLYSWRGEWFQDNFDRGTEVGLASPVLTSTLNGEKFFARRFDGGSKELDKYRKCILNPIFRDMGLWPADMIELYDEHEQSRFGLFVQHEYTDMPTPKNRWSGHYALLFPVDEYQAYECAEDRLARIDSERGWKSLAVRQMAVQITKAIEHLNRVGYVYCDIHLTRFFFAGVPCYLDFSNLAYPISDLDDSSTKVVRAPSRGEYPREFAEPAYVQGVIDAMDMRTQNYSLSALLFYLLLGRYAYDGNMTEHLHGDSLISHYNMLDFFLEAPIFIFDPKDRDNELGTNLQRNRETLMLWEELPSDMQELFTLALSTDAAERKTDSMPAPSTWLRQFEEHGWIVE